MSFSNIKEVQQIRIPNADKIVHFILYSVLSFLWMWSLITNAKHSFKKNASFIFLIGTCFGIVIEILQEIFTQSRSGEILDVVSNCSGILFGLLISKIVLK
nr:VanZ family protein [uncultured Flavobacterium sp.]